MGEPSDSKAQNKIVAALTRHIYLGETAEALALIRPDLPLDRVAHGASHTPLMAAIENGNRAVFDALLAAGASIGAQGEFGDTPLHAAARQGNEDIVHVLLERGADVSQPIVRKKHQFDGRTPLMEAAIGGKLPIVKLLLERGANPLAKDTNGWTALTFAEMRGKRIAEFLRKAMNASPAASDLTLHDAARAGLAERVRALLDQGAGADARDNFGRAPLHWAAFEGHPAVAELLLDRGAPVDAADKRGSTPLALIQDNVDVAKLLLARGADPNLELGGATVLLFLAMFHRPELLAAVIEGGGNLDAKDKDGRGIFDYAKNNTPRARKFLKERLGIARDAIDALYDHLKELPKLAKAPAFEATTARLGGIFNRKPAPWKRRKGAVYFHDVSLSKRLAAHFGEAERSGAGGEEQASRLLARLADEVGGEGFLLVYTGSVPEDGRVPLILLPTPEKYAALLASGTNGINKGHDTEAVIRWLQEMERENPFRLGGCGHDFLHGRFTQPIKDAEALAERMIAFCPDMADQATHEISSLSRPKQVRAIAREMEATGWFGFWWD